MQAPGGARPPVAVRLAAASWIAGGLLSVGGGVQMFLGRQRFVDAMVWFEPGGPDRYAGLTQELTGRLIGVFFGADLVVLAGMAVLYAVFAVRLWSGRNWARIALLVFAGFAALGGLSLLLFLVPPFRSMAGILPTAWLTWIGAAFVIFAAALSYVPSSAGYFEAVRSTRLRPFPPVSSTRS